MSADGDRQVPVLVVEDDRVIGEQLRLALTGSGYTVTVATTGAAARAASRERAPRLVLLDLGLPDTDGFALCRSLRAELSDAVMVVLTARHEELAVVAALESGADDYLTKPFRVVELLARIRAHLRRQPDRPLGDRTDPGTSQVLDLIVDEVARTATVGRVTLELRNREFDLLARFASAPGAAVRREQLLDDVWDQHWDGSSKTLDVHVLAIRRKLEDAARQDPAAQVPSIRTLRGFGYRLEAAVESRSGH